MPTIYDLKPAFQRLLIPACDLLGKRGISPNQVTVATTALCAAQGLWTALLPSSRLPLLLLPVVLLARMALNAIDGLLAVRLKQKTRLGALLNEMGDVVSDTLLYLPLALSTDLSPSLLVLVVITGILVEMAGVVSIQIGAERRYDGPVGKSDRAFLFGLIGLLLGLGLALEPWLDGLLALALLLSLYTLFNRAHHALADKDR